VAATRGIQEKEPTLMQRLDAAVDKFPLKARTTFVACTSAIVAHPVARIAEPFLASFHSKPKTHAIIEFAGAATLPFLVNYLKSPKSLTKLIRLGAAATASYMGAAHFMAKPFAQLASTHSALYHAKQLPIGDAAFMIAAGFTLGILVKGLSTNLAEKLSDTKAVQWLKDKLRQERPDSFLPT
jgi:hypothetical protein